MRRRRQGLQVSTFPFLAVLLCAMGSLILLLLVIDRRAKAVARMKAAEAMSRVKEDDARVAAAKKAEWESRRRALHALLQEEDGQVVKKVLAVDGQLQRHRAECETADATYQKLIKGLAGMKEEVGTTTRELAGRREELGQEANKKANTSKELARLTEELSMLEQTVSDLKLLHKRDQKTYSLIPYLGKRGDNRKPIYIECAAGRLIFHPDRVALEGPRVTVKEVLTEVERQMARQRQAAQTVAGKKPPLPYLLMLVRPDGIMTYFKVLSVLEGMQFEYGYEMVDQDWVLDFSEDGDGKRPDWMVTARPPLPKAQGKMPQPLGSRPHGASRVGLQGSFTERSFLGQEKPSPNGDVGQGGLDAAPSGVAADGGRKPAVASALADPFQGRAGGWPQASPPPDESIRNGSASLVASGRPQNQEPQSPVSILVGSPEAMVGIVGAPSFSSNSNSWGRSARPQVGGDIEGAHSEPVLGTAKPGTAEATGTRPARSSEPSHDSKIVPPGDARAATSPMDASATANGHSSVLTEGVTEPSTGARGPQQADAGERSGSAKQHPTVPSVAGNKASGSSSEGGFFGGSEGHSGGGDGQTRQGGLTAPGSGAGEPPANSFTGTGANGGQPGPRPAPIVQPSLSKTIGNREWIIPVECRADGVHLRTARLQFSADLLSGPASVESPLTQAVREMIARRQATVRPGDPLYRPVLQFQVQPDGARAYYLAYPLLRPLGVRMSRKDIEPEAKKVGS